VKSISESNEDNALDEDDALAEFKAFVEDQGFCPAGDANADDEKF